MSAGLLILIPAFDPPNQFQDALGAKALAASLLRTDFPGQILIIHNSPSPIFRIARQRVEEVALDLPLLDADDPAFADSVLHNARCVCDFVLRTQSTEWLMVIDPRSIALRNIDHLFGIALQDPGIGALVIKKETAATPGTFAVRRLYLQKLKDALATGSESLSQSKLRLGSLLELALYHLEAKSAEFERGEVLAPDLLCLNFQQLASAALINFANWPEEERSIITQGLYFGKFFGDPSGLILKALEA